MPKIFLLSLLILTTGTHAFSQAGWEYEFVRDVNPRYPSSDVWKTFSAATKPLSVLIPAGMLAAALIEKNRDGQFKAYEAFAGLAVATVATQALKIIVKRQRPYQKYNDIYPDEADDSYSFPSNHASLAFATATSLLLNTKKWYIAVPAFAWAAGAGYSRMYLGQHYPSDVFTGAVIGAGSAWACHWLNKKLFPGKKKKNEQP